jgi:hypothetical protein
MTMGYRFNPPPNWPAPPSGWVPPPGWSPLPEWPTPPLGWQLWVDDAIAAPDSADGDQISRLGLGPKHARAVPPAEGPDAAPVPTARVTASAAALEVPAARQAGIEQEGEIGLFDAHKRAEALLEENSNLAQESKQTGKKSWLDRVYARTDLRGLGVRIEDDHVSTLPGLLKARRLGPLKGAHAEVTAGTRQHRIGAAAVVAPLSLGAGLLIGLTKKSKAVAFVVFADGTVHERKLDGSSMISNAQRDVVKFNALAAANDG